MSNLTDFLSIGQASCGTWSCLLRRGIGGRTFGRLTVRPFCDRFACAGDVRRPYLDKIGEG